jgi:D-alanyl-lipoteichoic acid acyltransferase DltB (MBOAT superfamily)
MKIRNTFIIFVVSGFWHGANWTFIIWGALNAIYFIPLLLTRNNRINMNTIAQNKLFPGIKEFGMMIITFSLTLFAWIFFRAENLAHAFSFISGIFSESILIPPSGKDFIGTSIHPLTLFALVGFFLIIEWIGREGKYAIEQLFLKWNISHRYLFYYAIILLILMFGGNEQEFIYFQF